MLPFWLDLGALPGLQLILVTVASTAFFLLPAIGFGGRS